MFSGPVLSVWFSNSGLCTFQLAVVMWLMTYIGAVFNGLSLLILGEKFNHPVRFCTVVFIWTFWSEV